MKSFDGLKRKRIFLFRHGEVSYLNEENQPVKNPAEVCLTKRGIKEAKLIDANTKKFIFDRIGCSGLLRTKQTAELLHKRRNLKLLTYPELEEIKGGTEKNTKKPDIAKDIAYHFENITSEEDKFFGSGEKYLTVKKRVISKLESILKEEWNTMALVLHGGVNSIILSWMSDMPIKGAAKFDQVPGCMNILDFDLDNKNKIRRKLIRVVNIPPDIFNSNLNNFTSWEGVAEEIQQFL